MNNLSSYFQNSKIEIDNYLKSLFNSKEAGFEKIIEAMSYSLYSNGKRFRAILSFLIGDFFFIERKKILPIAAAIEIIHTYTLIHDDLPAMDNDDYRRGILTNHKVFGEAIAILAGDGLLTFAFKVLSKHLREQNIKSDIILDIIEKLSDYAGYNGVIGGQVVDILSENKDISEKELKFIHENKTGKLILASIELPMLLKSDIDKDIYNKIIQYGKNIGLIFQIKDDILDETSSLDKLGKPVKSDQKNKKATYVSMYGLEKSNEILINLKNETVNLIKTLDNNTFLIDLVEYLYNREK